MKELTTIVYDSKTTTIDQHIMLMREKRDALTRIGLRLADDTFAILLANSVHSGFTDIASAFKSRLLIDEEHVISTSDVTKALGAADVTYRRTGVGSEVLKVWTRPQNRSGTSDQRTCFWCDMKGHAVRDCRKKKEHDRAKASGQQGGKSESRSAKLTEVEADVTEAISSPWDDPVEVTVSPVDLPRESTVAVFDTGATHHVFNDRTRFLTFRKTAVIPVKLADGSRGGCITGVGTVMVESFGRDGGRLKLEKVYLCETLKHNLISGVALFDDGIFFGTDERGLYITSNEAIRIDAMQKDRKWILRVCGTEVSALISDSYVLWHERFGHPSERVLRQMISDQSCFGLPEKLGASKPCETCMDVKSTKTSSLASTMRTYDKPLHLVVADLCGPVQEKALGGASYFLQIRDEYSTFVKIYNVVNKYEVAGLVKGFIGEAQRLTGQKVVYWRNDGGGNFLTKN